MNALPSCGIRISRNSVNLELLRTFLTVAELGSLSRAAEAQRVAQSTLTRQMTALEQELGGRLLERTPSGVALTAAGHVLRRQAAPLLSEFDRLMATVREQALGRQSTLRVGYLLSAAPRYLHPALGRLRREHPTVKVALVDQSPGEQIAALRRGELDVGLVGQVGSGLTREFYVRRIATLPVWVALAETHPLAAQTEIGLDEVAGQLHVGVRDTDIPGQNRWVTQLCRRVGVRARFTPDAEGLTHALALCVTENAVSLVPDFTRDTAVPGVVYRRLRADPPVRWDLTVAWQRGQTSPAALTLVAALTEIGRYADG